MGWFWVQVSSTMADLSVKSFMHTSLHVFLNPSLQSPLCLTNIDLTTAAGDLFTLDRFSMESTWVLHSCEHWAQCLSRFEDYLDVIYPGPCKHFWSSHCHRQCMCGIIFTYRKLLFVWHLVRWCGWRFCGDEGTKSDGGSHSVQVLQRACLLPLLDHSFGE